MARHDEAKAGGLFDRIGNFVVRWPLIVIGCWIAVAAALTLLLPTLQAQAAKREQAPLPPGAPSMVLQKEMSAAFQEKIETSALLLVLLTNENGLGPADEAVYRKLIENLRADTQDKISVQDFLAVPEMKELLASKDNKAWNLPITFAGDAASPETQAAFKRVAAIVKQTVAGTSLTVHLSGPIATVADLTELGEKDVRIIEIGTAVSVLIILILVYRNLVTMLVPLATIGASVVTAQGTLSGLAEFGLAVNMQAIVFMSADGSAALAAGVQELVDQVKKMGSGLNEAADFLLGIKRDADKPSMAGFNIPPQIFSRDEFKKGAQIFLSADGHAARYFVQSALNPATTEAMDQVNDILRVADSARPNTELEDATIGLAGVPTALRDIRDYYNSDMKFIVIATIVIVFLILVILLRALVAPIYLIGSVLISYLSALGIGTLVFQLILGQEMHWSLPGLSFILLVAIGADYNMLLISRIRDESPHGIRIGVIRTVGSTGGVITSAGLIFAASMFGLVGASINTMAQAGFTIGIGIVLDTFLVRTVTVPALTTMIGRANWWPSELGRDPSTPPTKADRWLRRVKGHRRKAPIPAPKPPHTKVVRNTNGHASKAATKSVPNGKPADLAEGNGEYLIDHLRRHSLPLFGYAAMPAYDVVDGVSKPNGDGAHIGKEPVDHLLGHSLPLFGLAGLPSYDRWDDTSIGEPAVGHAGSKPDAKLST